MQKKYWIQAGKTSVALAIPWTAAVLFLFRDASIYAQEANYGLNDMNGKYADMGDAKIYYEVYGKGKPIVLLHGGFAYIDQFKTYIPLLSKKYKVIAVATRGYGKSEIGNKKFTYDLLAEDVKKIIQAEKHDKAMIIGFSDGAMTAYCVACHYPEIVERAIGMGGALGTASYTQEGKDWLNQFNGAEFEQYRPNFKGIMPQPERWDDFIENLRGMWSMPQILKLDDLKKIQCPVMLMYGDHDHYCTMQRIAEIYLSFPNARLVVFPESGHIDVSFRESKNTPAMKKYILDFLE